MLGPALLSASAPAAPPASASSAASASSDARRDTAGDAVGELAALALPESFPSFPFPFPPFPFPFPPTSAAAPALLDLPSPDFPPDTPMLPMELSMLLLALRITPDGTLPMELTDLSSDDDDALGGAVPAGRTGMGTGGGGGGGGSKAPSDSKPSSGPVEGAPGMFTPPTVGSPPAASPPVASSGRSQRHSWQSCPTLPNRSVSARSSVTRRSS
mmetsp:Transcript_4330/g.17753  ORF Transcript_4330/g.17753 Transcript_4330/m.17753 type:complete len:214 (+) Transcript_4330:268-909(+)